FQDGDEEDTCENLDFIALENGFWSSSIGPSSYCGLKMLRIRQDFCSPHFMFETKIAIKGTT
ncbi:hypothetical protein M8C21_013246, partial [Ambrosia artemisiifolia]